MNRYFQVNNIQRYIVSTRGPINSLVQWTNIYWIPSVPRAGGHSDDNMDEVLNLGSLWEVEM